MEPVHKEIGSSGNLSESLALLNMDRKDITIAAAGAASSTVPACVDIEEIKMDNITIAAAAASGTVAACVDIQENKMVFDQSKYSENADGREDYYTAEMDCESTKSSTEEHFLKDDIYFEHARNEVRIIPSQSQPLAVGNVHAHSARRFFDCGFKIGTKRILICPIVCCIGVITVILLLSALAWYKHRYWDNIWI